MAIVLEESIVAAVTTGDVTLASWTPGSNELLLLLVGQNSTGITPSISGNGMTWDQVATVTDSQSVTKTTLYRAQGSPSSGAITVTLTGNTAAAAARAFRFSGVATGSNGATAVEANTTAQVGASDNNDLQVSVTTLTDDAWAAAFSTHRYRTSLITLTLDDETALGGINTNSGTGNNDIAISAFYQAVATAGSTQLGGANDLSGNTEWTVVAISIKPGSSGTTYTQSNSGTLTSSGAIIRKAKKTLAGTLTTAGAIIRKAKKTLAGTLTTAGTLTKKTTKAFAGTLTTAGALTAIRTVYLVLAGTLTTGGALTRKAQKTLAGTLITGGAVVKKTFKTFAGTLTSAGGLTSQILQIFYQAVGGTLTTAGGLTRKAKKTLGGTLTTVGAIIRKTQKSMGGTLTSSGAVNRGIAAAAVALTVAARAVLSLSNRLQTWAVAVRNTFTVRNK